MAVEIKVGKQVLIKRLITGLVLGILAILGILYFSFLPFLTAVSVLILFSAWEWSRLMGCQRLACRILYLACIIIAMYLAIYLPVNVIVISAFCWWIFAAFLIVNYPSLSKYWSKGIWLRGLMGVLTLVPAWFAVGFVYRLPHGVYLLLLMLFIIWSADTGAYFFGKWFGKHNLLPKVSPKKTWEGLFGGMFFAVIIAILYSSIVLNFKIIMWPKIIILSVIVTIFSVVGDLLESMLKRGVGVKDSGNVFPGHGGFLDRFDSLMAAAPIFLLLFQLIKL